MKNILKFSCAIISLLVVLMSFPSMATQPGEGEAFDVDSVYRIGAGDKLKITVYEEPDLSGEFEIDGSGVLAMPLVGNIKAGGLDLRAIEGLIAGKLKDGYLVNPRVNIEVMNFRPFFILGEVNKPGSYPYVSGMTVINAVALAAGYTARAKTGEVTITRGKGDKKQEIQATEDEQVNPGDSIRINERLF